MTPDPTPRLPPRVTWPLWRRLLGFPPPWNARANLIASQRERLVMERERLILADTAAARREREQDIAYIDAALDSLADDGVLAIPKGAE